MTQSMDEAEEVLCTAISENLFNIKLQRSAWRYDKVVSHGCRSQFKWISSGQSSVIFITNISKKTKKLFNRFGEIAQWLRTFAALSEDPSSVSNIYIW